MQLKIPKFERDMLYGENIAIRERRVTTGFEIDKPCLFLLTPKDFHEIIMEDRPESYSINISFTEQIIDKKLAEVVMTGPVVLYLNEKLLQFLIEDMLRIYENQSGYREIQLKHLLNDILIRVLEQGVHTKQQNTEIHPVVRGGIAYIITHLSEQITLADISKRFGVSETYFSHLFRQSVGVPFKQYQLARRIDYAKSMLAEKGLSILEIGSECGFVTPSQFNRVFKEKTGMTPSQYRKSTK